MSLRIVQLKNLNQSLELTSSPFIDKESLLYIINNEAATGMRSIYLGLGLTKYMNDEDVVQALANHPNIVLVED